MKKIYFRFYDQLPEPISTWAKENWDAAVAKIITHPNSIKEAIDRGFCWETTPQDFDFWQFVFRYADPETLLSDCKKKFPELFKKTKSAKRVKIQIKQNRDGTWRWKLLGANGEPLNDKYPTKGNAKRAALKLKEQIGDAEIEII